ncbi:hypothetical protein OGAPHI_001523 [Ogataea philodendri]|uniref:Uncharacterized protein n=1 Tax=Ogataea philodendri TaxID=1378263 RepID=A0A9P8PDP6_9ASCO|nr:uncharacterized protein OGAPHI_001523 [Ogataea philodendri]KAH3669402.1 hypothetical protein OGAPHI_001523 [Ogataea philodendri]
MHYAAESFVHTALVNRYDTDSPLWSLLIASANVGQISIISSLGHTSAMAVKGIEFVHTIFSNDPWLILGIAWPLKIPWVTMATTDLAPFSKSRSDALHNVPHVSAMSSTKTHTLPVTSPTRTMRLTSFALARSLWIKANGVSSLSASEATRLAPPASGDTITRSVVDSFKFIYFSTSGSA